MNIKDLNWNALRTKIGVMLIFALGGCFADFGVGPSFTHRAPPPPTGDGGYYRGGLGLGWGTEHGTVQASGDVLSYGDIEAAGGALQASIFVDSEHEQRADAGWAVIARGFVGSGIGNSDMTEEFSLGGGFAGWRYKDAGHWAFDNVGIVLSAYRTTFADRPVMWSYGLNVTMTLDPVGLVSVMSGGRL